jgi:hypothetical protein
MTVGALRKFVSTQRVQFLSSRGSKGAEIEVLVPPRQTPWVVGGTFFASAGLGYLAQPS